MPTLQAGDLADLVATTQRDLGPNKWTDISYDLTEHVALPKMLKKEKVGFGSGTAIQFNVLTADGDNARNVGLFETDSAAIADGMTQATVPWRHTTVNYSIERREIAMNRKPARIVELVKIRRHQAMVALAVLMENNFWGKPASSSDATTPFGVDYWIVKNASEGFNGGLPSGFNDVAGLSTTTYANWKNYTAQYTNITRDDLVRKWRKAATLTNFKAPVDHPNYNVGNRFGYYTNYDVLGKLEELLEDQNESLGNDVASKDGKTMFRGVPVTYVPKLDADAQDPIYGINWGVFKPIFLESEFMKESEPMTAPNQHTVVTTHIDLSYNWTCYDRRRLFILNIA